MVRTSRLRSFLESRSAGPVVEFSVAGAVASADKDVMNLAEDEAIVLALERALPFKVHAKD